ncbi:hypothetical protein HS125_10590 [bacterium]|nr:hypothetical protein [bacterium]
MTVLRLNCFSVISTAGRNLVLCGVRLPAAALLVVWLAPAWVQVSQSDLSQVLRLKAQGQIPAAYSLVQNRLAQPNLPTAERMQWQEQLALLLTQMGRHAEAREAMQKIGELPGFAESAYAHRVPSFLADSFLAEGQRDAAVAALLRALEAIPSASRSRPEALELRAKLASMRFSTGDYVRAASELLELMDHPELPRRDNAARMLIQLYAVEVLTDAH